MKLPHPKTKIAITICALLLMSGLGAAPAHAAGQLGSGVYAVDRVNGILKGVLPGATAAQLVSNMSGGAGSMSVLKPDGSACTGSVATGMRVTLTEGGAEVDALTVAVTGDPSADGRITVSDYTMVRLHLLELKSLSGAALGAADADLNGAISISDYTRIRLHILGLQPLSGSGGLSLSGCTIGLDPGHQRSANNELEPLAPGSSVMNKKVSSGTQGRYTRVPEYEVNLQVGLKLKAKLEELGATVVMTRTTHDVNISNAERAAMMNNAAVNCWLRIHADGNDDPSVHGVSILVPAPGTMNTGAAAVQENSVKLAGLLLDEVTRTTGAKSRGLKPRDDQTGFCWSSVPVCNIEMGYMTNEAEDRLLVTDDYQNKIVDGLVQGFLKYFE